MKTYKCEISKGLPKIVKNMKEPEKPTLDTKISGAPNLDKACIDVIDLILRDYIENWYKHISSSKEFTYEVRQAFYKILGNFSNRCRHVDWISLITENLPNEIGSHIRLYRLSNQQCRNKDKDLHEEFFTKEADMEKEFCRQKICTDPDYEKDYLRRISEFILYIITTSEEFNVPPLRYLLRETLVNAVLLPTINMVSDPDFINQYIVWMCKENSYTSEYFIQAVKMSDCSDELEAVLEKLNIVANRLRSRDSGGDDDTFIKAELGSLDFVTKICQSRLSKLKEPKGKEEDMGSLTKSVSIKRLLSITPEFILENQIGISYFTEFLTGYNLQKYMVTYLHILEFQSTFNKLTDTSEDLFFYEERGEKSISGDLSSEQLKDARDLFNEAKSLNISDKVLSDTEKKINPNDLNENMFSDIAKEIINFLREKNLFEEFKMSHYIQKFFEEIDFFRDDSLKSEEDLGDANQIIGNENTSASSSQCSEPNTYTVRIVDAGIINNNYVLYTLVIIKVDKYGTKETWKTQRRYRDFDAINNAIINKYGKISSLRFPAKKPFNNMSKDFLEKRSLELQDYLTECFKPETLQKYPGILPIIVRFVQPDSSELNKNTSNKIQSIVNPFKSVGSVVLSMPDKLYSTISPTKRITTQNSITFNTLQGDQFDNFKSGNDRDQAKVENIPIRILFLLVDEIFDLQNKSQVVRRSILSILRRIVKTFFGIKVNNIILEKAAKSTSADQVAELLIKLKDSMWPNGKLASSSSRDKMTKMRTRVLCRTKMLGSISDEVSQLLGTETTRLGIQKVFNLCQDQILNRRLAHAILQLVLQKIFAGHNLEKLMHHKLCPAISRKVCDTHKLAPPEWRDWECLQSCHQ